MNTNNAVAAPKEQTVAELKALIAALESKLVAGGANRLSIKISEKTPTVVSVYGIGRFPVSLHGGQWQRLLNYANDITAFINANPAVLVDSREKTPAAAAKS